MEGAHLYIREWRRFCGLKQDCLASATGLSQANISRIERGIVPYSRETLELIADALGIEASLLISQNPYDDPDFWRAWLAVGPDARDRMCADFRAFFKKST